MLLAVRRVARTSRLPGQGGLSRCGSDPPPAAGRGALFPARTVHRRGGFTVATGGGGARVISFALLPPTSLSAGGRRRTGATTRAAPAAGGSPAARAGAAPSRSGGRAPAYRDDDEVGAGRGGQPIDLVGDVLFRIVQAVRQACVEQPGRDPRP